MWYIIIYFNQLGGDVIRIDITNDKNILRYGIYTILNPEYPLNIETAESIVKILKLNYNLC